MADEKGKKPAMIARARQDPDNEHMVTIGAVWPFNNSEGYVVKLHTLPVNWDGSFILISPKEE